MTTYSIGSPPKISGIYLLTHRPTKRKYVGQAVNLHKRWTEWRWTFSAGGLHARNRELSEAIATTHPHEWDFEVLAVIEDKTDLDRVEQHVIHAFAQASPRLLLNRRDLKPLPEKQQGALPKTHLIDTAGNTIPYRAAAETLGVGLKTIVKRLAALRSQGVSKVKLCSKTKKLLPQ